MFLLRTTVIVLDGTGIGALPDAAEYGDSGANTLLHIRQSVPGFALPNMARLGLWNILGENAGKPIAGSFGKCREQSAAKDSGCGHFEIAGLIVREPYKVFDGKFPDRIIHELERRIGRKLIGNYVASGTEIIQVLGDEHVRTGAPIIYLSVDSLLQLAMHVEVIPLEQQYEYCRIARALMTGDDTVTRIICRPFAGTSGKYYRTEDRRDFAIEPPGRTLLDMLSENGKNVIGVGKIEDIFSSRGLTESYHTKNNEQGVNKTIELLGRSFDGLLFVNLVDFDMLYGHRKNPKGFADALCSFDKKLPEIMARIEDDDMLIITADHGCDPTVSGFDHTREYAPLLVYSPAWKGGVDLGVRDTFADIAQTIADRYGLKMDNGVSFLSALN